MVRYDSKTSILRFQHVLGRKDADPFVSTDLEVSLAVLPEQIRQLLILTAKLTSAHAAEQKLMAAKTDTSKDGKPVLFVGEKLQRQIQLITESVKKSADNGKTESAARIVLDNPRDAQQLVALTGLKT